MKAGLGSSVDGRGAKGRAPKAPPLGDPVRAQEPTVVINFDKNGPKEARAANKEYGNSMTAIFSELRSGPVHYGPSRDWDGKGEGVEVGGAYWPPKSPFSCLKACSFRVVRAVGQHRGRTLPNVGALPRHDREHPLEREFGQQAAR